MNQIKPLMLCLLLAFLAIPATAELEGWQYYKNIEIKENSGTTLTDYQVLLDLSGTNFPVYAKHDGADLRFLLNGKELSYWIEEFNPSAKTGKVWLKVPYIKASETVTLQMYYGNPSASAVSDGDKVFELFDDFEDGVLDNTKWGTTIGPRGHIVEDTGYVEVKSGGLDIDSILWSRNTFNNNYGWRSKVQVFPETGKYENIQFHLSDRQAHILNNGVRLLDVVGQNKFEWQKCVNGNFIFIGPTSARDGTYIISFIKHNSVFKGLLDDVVESTDNSITNMPYYLVFWTQDSAIIRIYYTFVHKYTSPEPTVTISAEQLVSSITLTKSIPSTDLQEATPTTVTLTIKNTGSKPINNLKITDTLPSSFKLVSGSLSKTISSLDAGESTTLEYTFEPVGIGSITLPKAVVTYGDKTASSKSITVNIIAKDSDNDGLSDKQELQLGTDPNSADSDNDGLPDKLEMDQGLNPRLADSDGDGINDKQDIYPQDKDNDGIPDSEDPLPTIPQNYVYAGIGLIILAGLVAVGAFINSQKNKKWKDTFYNALRVDIVPDKESYELDDNMAFTVSVSNNFGDIASGTVESPYFNTISLTRIKSGKVYREKVHIKAKEVGIFNGNATATITDERGNVHKLKESFSVEVTPYIPKLKIKVIGVEKYEPSTN